MRGDESNVMPGAVPVHRVEIITEHAPFRESWLLHTLDRARTKGKYDI